MPTERTAISCGVYQLFNLDRDNPAILKDLMTGYKIIARNGRRRNGFAQVIFSDRLGTLGWDANQGAVLRENGVRFATYLTAQFPTSQITELTAKRSPSTGHTIRTWIWNIPHPSFKKHPLFAKAPARRAAERNW